MKALCRFPVLLWSCLLFSPISLFAQTGAGANGAGGGAGGAILGLKYILLPRVDHVTKNKFSHRIANLARHFFWGSRTYHYNYDDTSVSNFENVQHLYADSGRNSGLDNSDYYETKEINFHDSARLAVVPSKGDTLNKIRFIPFSDLAFTFEDTTDTKPLLIKYVYGVKNLYFSGNAPPDTNQKTNCCCLSNQAARLDSFAVNYWLMTNEFQFLRHKLKVFVTGMNQTTDTLTVKLWYRHRFAGRMADSLRKHLGIDSAFEKDYKFPVSYVPGGAWRKFILPFRTRYFIPVNLPIVRDFNYGKSSTSAWQANFLNAGMAYGWAIGRTKFFKYNQLSPRNEYAGIGPLFNIQSATSSAGSQTPPTAPSFAKVLLGGHIGIGFGSIQFILAGGYYYNISSSSGFQLQPKPWIGGGIGLSMFNFSVPAFTGGAGIGH